MMSLLNYLELIVLLPLVASSLAFILGRVIGRRASELLALIVSAIVFLASISLYTSEVSGIYKIEHVFTPFIPVKTGFSIIVDRLSKIFTVIIGLIGFLVILYSLNYMERDPGYARYYGFMLLFIASMEGLVLTNNIIALYAFWEAVGLCSFALIAHYYDRPRAGIAGIKAFITTRLGDIVFLAGIAYVYIHTHTLDIVALRGLDPHTAEILLATALVGAIAKSAQLPLHVWLPDAMEGPTPVSALIHAATMVKAGVYLIARLIIVLAPLLSTTILPEIIMWIGALTAFYAALSALAQYDAKRLLAYSTISQLGYIFAALGSSLALVSSIGAVLGHVISHAVFKALLFLCVGVIIHELEPLLGPETARDLRHVAGSARSSPIMVLSLFCGTMALAGIPPFNGFWSKDELIAFVGNASAPISIVLIITSLVTAAYSFKLFYYLVLARPREIVEKITRVPIPMTLSLLVLSALTLTSPILLGPHIRLETNLVSMIGALAAAITGIVLVIETYRRQIMFSRRLYSMLLEGFYIDRFYTDYLVPALRFVFTLLGIGMLRVVDAGLDSSVEIIVEKLETTAPKKSGKMSTYYALYALGLILLIMMAFAFLR